MAAVHFTAIPCERNTAIRHIESHIFFAKFVRALTTLCLLGLKFLELLCAFLCAFLGISYAENYE